MRVSDPARDADPRKTAPDPRKTLKLEPPPLNKRVRMSVPAADLAWFDLSDAAMAMAGKIDGTKTLLELMEGEKSDGLLQVVAELHDAGVLAYEK